MIDDVTKPTQGTALVLGAGGRAGREAALAFEQDGWTVRRFNRERDDLMKAAQGVDVIVNCLNPPNYHNWKVLIPEITRNVIAAAKVSGATVILPGNVYHFGDRPGVWSQQTPPHPVSKKGQIRLDMERTYQQSGIQTIILRAGNFIDPERRGCIMSVVYLRAIEQGKITLPGPAGTKQAMCYLPDWAKSAVALAGIRDQLATFEDIPFPGHTLSANDIKSGLERLLNRDLKFTSFPWGLFRLLAPFWELAREMNEMRYLWSVDHALSDQRLKELVPDYQATDLDEVLRISLPPKLQHEVEEICSDPLFYQNNA